MHSRTTALAASAALLVAAFPSLTTPAAGARGRPEASPVSHVNRCWSSDNGAPVVDSLISPLTVDTTSGPAAVELTVAAHDTGGPGPATGVGGVVVQLEPEGTPVDYRLVSSTPLALGSDGLWHGIATIPAGSAGTLNAHVTVTDRRSAASRIPESDLVGRQSYVSAVVVTASDAGDATKPRITGLTASTTHVNTTRHVRTVIFTVTATDADSGVTAARIDLTPYPSPAPKHDAVLHRVGTSDEFRGRARFERAIGNHHEGITVTVTDAAGNFARQRSMRLAKRGLPSRIDVVSGPVDRKGPTVTRVRTARTVDVRRRGRWLHIIARVADPQGVPAVTARLARLRLPAAALHRASGTRTRGLWKGRLRVTPCAPGPVSTSLRVQATDGNGLPGRRSRPLRIRSADHVAPRVAHARWRPNPSTFTFTEPVHGISSATVQVYDDDTSTGPHPISGAWTCRNRRGHQVSCRTGSVVQASFAPTDASVRPGVVDWEPAHHLDVLDAHGNPVTGPSEAPDVVD